MEWRGRGNGDKGKGRRGKAEGERQLRVPGNLDRFIPEQLTLNGFALLGVELRHVLRVASLPFHHRDPFDRLLATQALEEQLAIVSTDRVFRKYGVTTIW